MKRIIYPYNEILPTKRAHDVFVFNECAALSKRAHVTLVCGKKKKVGLFDHYEVKHKELHIKTLPILRKNFFRFSWNIPFFFFTQWFLKKVKPDVAILSVLKQGEFHLQRKLEGIHYVYEVHELQYYPQTDCDMLKVKREKEVLEKADLIVATTNEIAAILKKDPYKLRVPIRVIPLASNGQKLSSPIPFPPFKLGYVGQLYKSQGISLLFKALSLTSPFFHLKIIGGNFNEIEKLKKEALDLGILNRIEFCGFRPPSEIPKLLKDVHAFVAPFEAKGKMIYVAHTKLIEYKNWGRPVIVPDLNVVKECFSTNKGVLYFDPDNFESLAKTISSFENKGLYEKLLQESQEKGFTWEERVEHYLDALK